MPRCRPRWFSGFVVMARNGTSGPSTELRMRIAPTRFRVADVCLIPRSETDGTGTATVPRLPSSKYFHPKTAYRAIRNGLTTIARWEFVTSGSWIRRHRRGYDCSTGSWIETTSFAVEGSPIAVDLYRHLRRTRLASPHFARRHFPSSTRPPSHSPSGTTAGCSAASAPSGLRRGSRASSTESSAAARW